MKVNKHTPEPVKTPPPTFDLLGLTEDEVRLIRMALGAFSGDDAKAVDLSDGVTKAGDLWSELKKLTNVSYTYNNMSM